MMRLSLTRMVECTQGKLTWSLLSLMEKESQFTRTNRSMWDIGAMDSFMGRADSLGLMDHGMKGNFEYTSKKLYIGEWA